MCVGGGVHLLSIPTIGVQVLSVCSMCEINKILYAEMSKCATHMYRDG